MTWIATAVVGSAVISAGVGMYSSNKAASAQSAASGKAAETTLTTSRESIAFQKEMFEKGREDMAPWLEAGKEALSTLGDKIAAGPGDFEISPGYEFRKAEGEKAVERSAAARGGLLSGATGKALTRFGQDHASNEYGNFLNQYYQSLNPLQSLAGIGQTTASTASNQAANLGVNVGNTTTTAGNAIAQNQIAAGQAQASGVINTSNAVTGNINSGINNYLAWKYFNPGTSSGSGYGTGINNVGQSAGYN